MQLLILITTHYLYLKIFKLLINQTLFLFINYYIYFSMN